MLNLPDSFKEKYLKLLGSQEAKKLFDSLNQETKKVNFTELKNIQYEDDEYVFIDYYKNQKEGLKTIQMYDEIIINPNVINKNIKISRW